MPIAADSRPARVAPNGPALRILVLAAGLLTALAAEPAWAVSLVSDARYSFSCSVTQTANTQAGVLDAATPSTGWTGTDQGGQACGDAMAAVGNAAAGTGAFVSIDARLNALGGLLNEFEAVLEYDFAVIPNNFDPNNPPAPIPIPVTIFGRAEVQTPVLGGMGSFAMLTNAAVLSSIGFTNPNADPQLSAAALQAFARRRVGFAGTDDECLGGTLLGSSCSAIGFIQGTPLSLTTQVITLRTAAHTGNVGGGGSIPYLASVDPRIEIDPTAEFAPGQRYADFYHLEISPGVVNAIPEPGSAGLLAASLLGVARLKRRRG